MTDNQYDDDDDDSSLSFSPVDFDLYKLTS